MKITLEPTADHWTPERPPTVTIVSDSDDMNMEAVAELFRRAAIAWGFQPEVVKQYIPEE